MSAVGPHVQVVVGHVRQQGLALVGGDGGGDGGGGGVDVNCCIICGDDG